jgi:hypothetical protein
MWSAPRLFARQLRGNTPLQQEKNRGAVFSALRLYERDGLKVLSVGDSHGNLVVEERLGILARV